MDTELYNRVCSAGRARVDLVLAMWGWTAGSFPPRYVVERACSFVEDAMHDANNPTYREGRE